METPVLFGEWLKQRRKILDLTQEELSERAGCSVFALRKIESGERRPSKQLAALLASALEITEEERPTFIRVARGDLNLERLRILKPDTSPPSIADLLTLQQAHETVPPPADVSTPLSTGLEPASHHLPLPPTPLLGRDAELAALERLFNDPQCRLLTLTGLGGIGKTRLAIEFAARQRAMFPGGVFYVPLAPIDSPDLIIPAIADALKFVFSGPLDPQEQLLNYMADGMKQSVLLVLDNLEHLLSQSPTKNNKTDTVGLVSEILERLPRAKTLTTSRERLNLRGEWTYELHGLPVPPVEFADKLDDYSAAALFIQSARRARAEFEAVGDEQPALIQICRLLEGIPLAIELAAAWVGTLSCAEIAKEIESNIDFLTASMRDMPERHRSLRATFDHSWKLLSDHERDVLSRLSVFHGGFDRNAAEKVAGATLPLLASLVSKSLVRRVEKGRYDLHEVIRQYASSRLDENQSRCLETCDLHSEHYLELVSRYETALKSAAQQETMRELTGELDNLRAAWIWGIKRGMFGLIAKATRAFGWYFEVSGLLREGIEQLEPLVRALQVETRNDELNRLSGLALMQEGLLYFRKGQFGEAQKLYEESIAILRPIGDQTLLADALIFLGTLTHLDGEYEHSKLLVEEGLACAQAADDQWFAAYGIYNLGYIESLMGDYQKGYEQMLVGLDMWRALGDPNYIALGLNFLVTTLIKLGRYEEAKAFMRESIALCEQTKNRWGLGTAYRYLGSAYLAGRQYTEAQAHFRKSLEIFGEYTEGWDIALSLYYLGETAMRESNLPEARNNFTKALRISLDAHSIPITLDILLGLARLQVQAGKPEHALELSYYVLNHPSITQETRDRAIEINNETRKLLTDTQIQAIKEDALNRTFEEIVMQFAHE